MYMFMSQDQDEGQYHNIKTGNQSFESVKHIKYLDITLTIRNSTLEEIKSTLNSGSACYHLMQKSLSSSLISKNIKIKIKMYRIIILPVDFLWV